MRGKDTNPGDAKHADRKRIRTRERREREANNTAEQAKKEKDDAKESDKEYTPKGGGPPDARTIINPPSCISKEAAIVAV